MILKHYPLMGPHLGICVAGNGAGNAIFYTMRFAPEYWQQVRSEREIDKRDFRTMKDRELLSVGVSVRLRAAEP